MVVTRGQRRAAELAEASAAAPPVVEPIVAPRIASRAQRKPAEASLKPRLFVEPAASPRLAKRGQRKVAEAPPAPLVLESAVSSQADVSPSRESKPLRDAPTPCRTTPTKPPNPFADLYAATVLAGTPSAERSSSPTRGARELGRFLRDEKKPVLDALLAKEGTTAATAFAAADESMALAIVSKESTLVKEGTIAQEGETSASEKYAEEQIVPATPNDKTDAGEETALAPFGCPPPKFGYKPTSYEAPEVLNASRRSEKARLHVDELRAAAREECLAKKRIADMAKAGAAMAEAETGIVVPAAVAVAAVESAPEAATMSAEAAVVTVAAVAVARMQRAATPAPKPVVKSNGVQPASAHGATESSASQQATHAIARKRKPVIPTEPIAWPVTGYSFDPESLPDPNTVGQPTPAAASSAASSLAEPDVFEQLCPAVASSSRGKGGANFEDADAPENPFCDQCGEFLASGRNGKGVQRGLCCNTCPNHGPLCTSHNQTPEAFMDLLRAREERDAKALMASSMKPVVRQRLTGKQPETQPRSIEPELALHQEPDSAIGADTLPVLEKGPDPRQNFSAHIEFLRAKRRKTSE